MSSPPVLPVRPVRPARGDRLFTVNDPALTFDAGLALVLAVICAGPYLTVSRWAVIGSAALCLTLAIRRVWPLPAVLLGAAACLFLLAGYDRVFVGIVVVPVLIYSVARWADRRIARVALIAGLLGSVLGPARWFGTQVAGLGPWALVGMTGLACAAIAGGAYLIGRRRQESVQQGAYRALAEREQERLLFAEQQQRARTAAVDERTRIARELHDIVAHSLSVIVIQAEGGKALAGKRPERAPEVLETIAETSREALEEMRRMVGLLRSGDPAALDGGTGGVGAGTEDYRPAPGLGDLSELVRKTSERARLQIVGSPPPVSQALGLSVYRIVQESLTNVLKHAGPAAIATVAISYTQASIVVQVTDDGHGAAARGDGQGHGLQGIRERVALHRGSVAAGPCPDGGFAVRANLPLLPERATRPMSEEMGKR